MELLSGVAQNPTIGGATIGLAFIISYIMTKPQYIGTSMNPILRAVVIGGSMLSVYILYDLAVKVVSK